MELFSNRKCQVAFHSDIFSRREDGLAEVFGRAWALEQATSLATPQFDSEQAVVGTGSSASLDDALERLAAFGCGGNEVTFGGFSGVDGGFGDAGSGYGTVCGNCS